MTSYIDTINLNEIAAIAVEAGEMARERSSNIKGEVKPDKTYVTDLDRELEIYIEQRLKALYPDFAFQGEEYGFRGNPDAPRWSVDPIDGTTNLVLGSDIWSVAIALVDKGEAVLGVVAIPKLNHVYSAKKGFGAYRDGEPITCCSNPAPEQEDPLGLTSRATKYFRLDTWKGTYRISGSLCIDLMNVADGKTSAMLGFSRSLHDIAAGFCIAQEAGCEITFLDGSQVDLNEYIEKGDVKKPFVIANPIMRQWVMANMKPLPDAKVP